MALQSKARLLIYSILPFFITILRGIVMIHPLSYTIYNKHHSFCKWIEIWIVLMIHTKLGEGVQEGVI